jgi:hypothetical protein
MNPSQLSADEFIWLSLLVLQILGLFAWSWSRTRERLAWYQPPVVLAVIFIYYTVLGPLNALQNQDWVDRGVNLRDSFVWAWEGAAVAFASFLAGYGLLRQRLPPPRRRTSFDPEQAWRLGQRLNAVGLSLFALVTGQQLLILLNPFTALQSSAVSAGLDLGPFANYGSLAINLLIPGLLLMTAAWAIHPRNPLLLLLWLLAAMGIYATLGFRYRLALLFSGMLLLWYLARGRQPRVLVVLSTIAGLLLVGGLIGLTRNYGRGLDLTALDGKNFIDILLAGFGESVIFLTSGGVMSLIPAEIPYAGITPLISTILFPIPSQLLENKASSQYLSDATATLYGNDVVAQGSAILNYAEYFLMGGWPVLIGGYLLLGWLFRRLWLWFFWRQQEPVAQVTYVCAVVYLYVIVSRGYLPQVTMLFCFTVLPLFIYYNRISRPVYEPSCPPSAAQRL